MWIPSRIGEKCMSETEFFDYLLKNEVLGDFIVLLEYADVDGTHLLKELLFFEDGQFVWNNDWDEGGDCAILGYISIDDVEISKRW